MWGCSSGKIKICTLAEHGTFNKTRSISAWLSGSVLDPFWLRSGSLFCRRHWDLYFLSNMCCCLLPGNRPTQRLILSRLEPEKHQGWLISIKPPQLVYNSRCREVTHGEWMLLFTELTPLVPHLLRIHCCFRELCACWYLSLVSMLTFPVLFWRLPLSESC